MIWVPDASVAIKWFLRNEKHANAVAVLERLLEEPGQFIIPELFSFEVYSVLCRLTEKGHTIFIKGVIPILNGGIIRHPMTEGLAKDAYHFVKKGLTGYDACYAALAKEMKGKWLTFDKKAHRCIMEEGCSHYMDEGLPGGWDEFQHVSNTKSY